MVSLNDKDLTDDSLNALLNTAPPRSILLLEDVDAAFTIREGGSHSHITFSGLLNALDGVAAQEGKLVFMTTNHFEKLDPALVRPGRVDLRLEFGLAKKYQVEQLFKRFYSSASNDLVAEFVGSVPNDTVTMAELQGYLLQHKTSPKEAIENMESFLVQVASKPNKEKEIKTL